MKSEDNPIAIAMLGRTASGKTTLASFLAENLAAVLVPEAAMKRALKTQYQTQDSLDEELRDLGYRAAIAACWACLDLGRSTVIDASFHKLTRRAWLYDAVRSVRSQQLMVIYCRCPNEEKTRMRILQRAQMPPKAETQANSMEVYRFIDSTFDELSSSEFAELPCVVLFVVDTDSNVISSVQVSGFVTEFASNRIELIRRLVDRHLEEARKWGT